MEALFFVLLLAAIAIGLQRNHTRQSGQPHSMMAGSTDSQDRDLERVVHDLPLARC